MAIRIETEPTSGNENMRKNVAPLALAVLVAAGAARADEILNQAQSLIAQQKAAEAVNLLAPLEEERAGNPDFDYLLGQALLESGDASNAVFAFERCLSAAPNDGPCRVQMARTHLALGETVNARAELETIQADNPPPEVQALVSQFLGAVSMRESQEKRQFGGFAQLGLGHDSNVNSATDASQIALPALNNVVATIPASSQALDSSFINAQAGASFQYRHSPKVISFGDAGVNSRSYLDESDFSYLSLDGSLGSALRLSGGAVSGKLSLQKLWMDGESYRDSLGLSGQYQHDIGMTGQIALFLQANRLSYDTQTTRDADRVTGGIAWSQSFDGPRSPVVFASAYTGDESMKNDANPAARQFGNQFSGLRLGGSLALTKTVKANAALSHEVREYDDVFTGWLEARDEDQTDVNVGLNWRLRPTLSLQPAYMYSQNNSNVLLFDTDRHVFSIDLRYDW